MRTREPTRDRAHTHTHTCVRTLSFPLAPLEYARLTSTSVLGGSCILVRWKLVGNTREQVGRRVWRTEAALSSGGTRKQTASFVVVAAAATGVYCRRREREKLAAERVSKISPLPRDTHGPVIEVSVTERTFCSRLAIRRQRYASRFSSVSSVFIAADSNPDNPGTENPAHDPVTEQPRDNPSSPEQPHQARRASFLRKLSRVQDTPCVYT